MSIPSSDEQEFWLFIPAAPLPDATVLQQEILQLDSSMKLDFSGDPEKVEDQFFLGSYVDEDGESMLDVVWTMSVCEARLAFKKNKEALNKIGNRSKMLRFILDDECALGHIFAIMYSIMNNTKDALLVIPNQGEQVIMERAQAMEFLKKELSE
jgi:hypothetical protein